MQTTVLGIRLTQPQREQLKEIARENKMSEVEAVRVLIESLLNGKIRIERGRLEV